MKKLVSFALAAVLCLGMTTTVMAANSPTTETNSPVVDNTVVAVVDKAPAVKSGNATVTTISDAKATYNEAEEAVVNAIENGGASAVKDIVSGSVNVASVAYVQGFDIEGTPGTAVTLAYTKISESNEVVVLHVKEDGTTEVLAATYTNGELTVTFNSFSPAYIVEYTAPVSSGNTYVPSVTETTSPKTADMSMALYVSMIAVVALGGVVYGTRKAR